jgi:hypothetical protein
MKPEEKLYGGALRIELAVALSTLYQDKQVPYKLLVLVAQ